jgi:glycerophosphoryl diester phosphodiesterase
VSATHPYFDTAGATAALAHRGFDLEGLENSMRAFAAAVELGYHYVETDAHGTRDGVAVALHDASLDRTTDSKGNVADLAWHQVKSAKIGGVEPVPLFEDLLGSWPHLRVNVDVKAVSGIDPIAAAIERTKAHDRVCVASFSAARRRATIKLLSRPVATSAGTSEAAAFWARATLGAGPGHSVGDVDALQVPTNVGPLRTLHKRQVDAAHRAGVGVHVWTVNDPEQMRRLLDIGVDGLISDRADLLKEVLIERGRWLT